MRVIISRCLLSAGLACVMLIDTKAQAVKTESSHTFTAGAGILVVKDDALFLSSENLSSTSLAWSFSNSNGYGKKSILAGFKSGSGNSAKASLYSNEFILQYIHAFSLMKNKSGRWNNYTGYSININPQYIKSGEQHSWASVNSISFYNSLERSWQKSVLSLDISVPLAGLGSRPGINTTYKGSVNDMLYNGFSNLEFTSLHNLKAASISLQYQQAISSRVSITAGASYYYKDMVINSRFMQQAYGIHAGLTYYVK